MNLEDEVVKLSLISKSLLGKKKMQKLKLKNDILIFEFDGRLIIICSDEKTADLVKKIEGGKEVNKNTFRFARTLQEIIVEIQGVLPSLKSINLRVN